MHSACSLLFVFLGEGTRLRRSRVPEQSIALTNPSALSGRHFSEASMTMIARRNPNNRRYSFEADPECQSRLRTLRLLYSTLLLRRPLSTTLLIRRALIALEREASAWMGDIDKREAELTLIKALRGSYDIADQEPEAS